MKKKDRKKLSSSLGGNELPKGSQRKQSPTRWDDVTSPPSIWERNDIFRSSLGTVWHIKPAKPLA
jgi:hypothetical protein